MSDLEHLHQPKDAGIPEAPPGVPAPEPEVVAKQPEAKQSPFDCLMVTAEEADRIAKIQRVETPADALAEPEQEDPEEDSGTILVEEVAKICKAIERLAKRGLNMRAVIALLHDSNPTIPKKHIKTVLEGLRELPVIYGHQSAKR